VEGNYLEFFTARDCETSFAGIGKLQGKNHDMVEIGLSLKVGSFYSRSGLADNDLCKSVPSTFLWFILFICKKKKSDFGHHDPLVPF
jgi:hypothetical protein